MPTTLEQLKTSLDYLLDAKETVLKDMSDISLLDDNDSIFEDYMLVLKRLFKNIYEVKRTIRLIEEISK